MRLILRGICCNWIALFSLKTIAIYSLLLHKQVLIKAVLTDQSQRAGKVCFRRTILYQHAGLHVLIPQNSEIRQTDFNSFF